MVASNTKDLDWLLNDLVTRLPGAERAVMLSADGLMVGRSEEMSREDAEHLAAMASAFQSLARGVGDHFGKGNVRQTVVELDHAFLTVTAAGRGACLALLAAENSDMEMIVYEMNVMIQQVGANLVAEPRQDVEAP
jgi:predicted regulator of Ras-like GTPase activity (Roadblock/LC7/MglB family)